MIYHPNGGISQGCRLFTTTDLKIAFGLSEEIPDYISSTSEDPRNVAFGQRLTCSGYFVRFGNLLNIPSIGTRDDNDPNVSINLEDVIKDAVQALISK